MTKRYTSNANRGSLFEQASTFGVRGSADRETRSSAFTVAPFTRQAITHALAPADAERPKPVRAGRRVKPVAEPLPDSAAVKFGPTAAIPDTVPPTSQIDGAAVLGRIIKAHRTGLGFSQQRLADLAGVGRRFISELEAGKPTLEFDRVVQCCRALGIDLFARRRG